DGALGDGGDPILQSDLVGELVDAFLADHGGIHVGEEKPLAPMGQWLHHHVDRLGSKRGSQPLGQYPSIDRRVGCEANVRRGTGREPRRFGVPQCAARASEHTVVERRRSGIRNQGRYMSHADKHRRGANRAVLIAGPTASGKSRLALALAEELGAIIVNADAIQVYRDLRILTARPSGEEEARLPHRLYGHVDAGETYSVGRWLRDVEPVLTEALDSGRMPIFVGGTGLYFKALTRGFAGIPRVPPAIRAGLRARLAFEGAPSLHAELGKRDPESAKRIRPEDGVRISRALEVLEATGRTLSDWHRSGRPALVGPDAAVKIFLNPDRAELYRRIDARFDAMIAAGALAEVRALDARGLEELHPALKAHGVPWLREVLVGRLSLEAAVAEAKQDTRR